MKPKKPFGKYAFANSRLPRYEVEPEKNTKIEDDVEKALRTHFKSGNPFSSNVVSTIKNVLDSGDYSDIIFEPDAEVVYRGMHVDSSWLSAQIDSSSWNLPEEGNFQKTFFFKPFNNQSSWSLDYDAAYSVAETNFYDRVIALDEGRSYIIILEARISDNHNKFISAPDGLYKLQFTIDYQDELECIGLGDIKVSKLSWREII